MLIKIISLFMSAVISLTSFIYTSFSSFIDTLSEAVYGIPYTFEAIKSDFFGDMSDEDVVQVDEVSGFVKNKIAVFLDEDMPFADKVDFFAKCKGILVGWCTPADLYVLKYPSMSYDDIIEECRNLSDNEGVTLSMPVYASKISTNQTPDDSFGEITEWNEIAPQGNNWWLEAVDARRAWDYEDYFSTADIGIVDSGFDGGHPELQDKIFFPNVKQLNRNYPSTHGTHVAGIIAAERNNSQGIAGINSNSRLICVDWSPEGFQMWNTELAVLFGFSAVVKAGAKVVNLSLGISSGIVGTKAPWVNRVLGTAATTLVMSSLLNKGYDFVAVQAAGNGNFLGYPIDASNNGHFSSVNENNIFTGFKKIDKSEILDRIIVVAAAENNGDGTYRQAAFSNVGPAVSIAAPGNEIYSLDTNSEYCTLSGTSMATPMVTAVASLVWSVNPDFKGPEIKEIVCTSTDKIAAINTEAAYFDDLELMDYPMVNAKLAVEEAIRRTDSTVGTLKGVINDESVSAVEFNEKQYTVLPDGSFSFVAPEGEGILNILDGNGNVIRSIETAIIAGEITEITGEVE